MAKRKAARATGRTTASKRSSASRGRSSARKAAGRTGAKRARSSARPIARKGAGKAATRSKARVARKATSRKATARQATGTRAKSTARKATASSARPPARRSAAPKPLPLRKAPGLDRERRTITDDDIVPTPPSSLDLDRSASAIRTGRKGLRDRFAEHTETSPALTGGDVDADWESAYSVGDEAPGGDNPTPDQDIVDDIGKAVGVEYQDNEELKGADKVAKRDKNRWELDPASSDDWDER